MRQQIESVARASRLARWRRPLVGALVAAALVVAAVSCTWNDGLGRSCTGEPLAGELSLWSACEPNARVGEPLSFSLSNGADETAWSFHDCSEQLPWLSRQEDDGSWRPLLPAGYSLAVECRHVETLEPGETWRFELSTASVSEPGIHRLELLVAWGCVELHDPHHLVSACERTELLAGEPFELRP